MKEESGKAVEAMSLAVRDIYALSKAMKEKLGKHGDAELVAYVLVQAESLQSVLARVHERNNGKD